MNKCIDCKFFKDIDHPDKVGECGRYPPQVFRTRDDDFLTLFPMVQQDWCCGEYVEILKKEIPSPPESPPVVYIKES